MTVAIVVQRYGAEINGGAELHARYIAERLARHVRVEVLTTCARDYITWADDYSPGASAVNGVVVRRFRVSTPRDPKTFGDWSARVFAERHSVNDELAWLEAEGPTSPDLIRHLSAHVNDYDYVLFFSFRYYHSYHGVRAVPAKAILVPTAERDEVLGLGLFPPILRSVRALMYNSPEERELLQAVAGTSAVPGVVVGVGSDVPARVSVSRFRQRTGITERTAIYIGRIDENKGCRELFDYWMRYAEITPGGLTLVLVGTPVLPVPSHPRIRHLGFVSDEEKYDALAAAEFLIMPSYFESLSMVALEAWALGKPVLANGQCDVLRGQAVRSNAGLYYDNYGEFAEAVRVLESSAGVAATLGQNGASFFRANYAWPVVERKYLDMFERLSRESSADAARTPASLPGWWRRRQRTLPPAREVLAGLPSGPVLASRTARPAPAGQQPESRLESRPGPRPDTRQTPRSETRPSQRTQGRPVERQGRSSSAGGQGAGATNDRGRHRGARNGRGRRGGQTGAHGGRKRNG